MLKHFNQLIPFNKLLFQKKLEMAFIEKPCPIQKNQLTKTSNNCYFCSGCKENVIDFRNSSQSEIDSYSGQKICGIFNENQLTHRALFSFRKKITFRLLGVLSFMGFAIHPVQASTLNINENHEKSIMQQNEKPKTKKIKKKKSKEKPLKTIGCPSF
jgi:hypothetical protein